MKYWSVGKIGYNGKSIGEAFKKRIIMIKLKTEVNKSAIMRDLHNEAVEIYKNAYEGEYAIKQFLYGAEKLFEKLRQPPVSGRSEQLVCYKKCGNTEPYNDICLNCGSSIMQTNCPNVSQINTER